LSEKGRIARQTTVEVCQASLNIEPLLVAATADAVEIMRRAAAQPETRVIGVLDDRGRIIGAIPILRLAETVIARVVPESFLADASDVDSVARFTHSIEDRTARDVMLPPAVVRPEATIGEAFRLMHQRRLSGLYVVDEDGRPTGYLDLLELAIRYADALDADDPRPA
jgi:CBS domain-containing protein